MTISSFAVIGVVLLLWAAAWRLNNVTARQALLLGASYVFYATAGFGFLAILIGSSLVNFAIGSILRTRLRPAYLWMGIAFNILLLGTFKYLPPLLALGGEGSWEAGLSRHILMPLGISFWTFQALSYLVDVYLEDAPQPTLLEFCLYMAFWPTVVSGPICRQPAMLPQLRKQPKFYADDVSAGVRYMVQGGLMKMYLAQLLTSGWSANAGIAAGYDQIQHGWGAVDVWLLGIGYGFLLFFDFAGYSLMALGVARLFGIRVALKFDRPFLAATPTSFWNRWHMSLSFWIRDYVFTPLSFARRDRWWPYVALMVSMTLFGLWHAAKWTFIVFGVYHGTLLVLHRLGQRATSRRNLRLPSPIGSVLSWSATFLLVGLGYVLFRANHHHQEIPMFEKLLSPSN
jgi:alginate O-acetyltransferase complex protein AlgI